MINVKKTGKNIKMLCRDKGITPNMIKDELRFTATIPIYNWFNGKSVPSLDNLLLIAELLGALDEIIINE